MAKIRGNVGRPYPYRRPRDAAKLRAARLRAGLSQAEVAGRLGLPQSYWSHLETGQVHLFRRARRHVRQVGQIAAAVGLTADDFLGEKPGKNPGKSPPGP